MAADPASQVALHSNNLSGARMAYFHAMDISTLIMLAGFLGFIQP